MRNILLKLSWFCVKIYWNEFYSYIFVFFYSYVSVCYSYVSCMLMVCVRMFRMLLVCYSYVTRMYSCGVLVMIEKYTQFACMNNKRCTAYRNYTQFACNWGTCQARVNIYTRVSHVYLTCILCVKTPYCTHLPMCKCCYSCGLYCTYMYMFFDCTWPHGGHDGRKKNSEKVFWEFDSIIMQNLGCIFLLFWHQDGRLVDITWVQYFNSPCTKYFFKIF